jgi:hypothetical protein
VIEQQLARREPGRIQIELAPVQADLVGRGGPVTKLSDTAPDRDTPIPDPLLNVTTRCQAGSRQQFLQSDHPM